MIVDIKKRKEQIQENQLNVNKLNEQTLKRKEDPI